MQQEQDSKGATRQDLIGESFSALGRDLQNFEFKNGATLARALVRFVYTRDEKTEAALLEIVANRGGAAS